MDGVFVWLAVGVNVGVREGVAVRVKVGDGVFVVVGEEDGAAVAGDEVVELVVAETAGMDRCEQPKNSSATAAKAPSIQRVPGFFIFFLCVSWCLRGLVVEIASILFNVTDYSR